MELIGPQIEALLAALRDAFGSRAALALMVRTKLEYRLNDIIAEGADMTEVTFGLFEWAERTGKIPDLVEGAYQANPGNEKLNAFYTTTWRQLRPPEPDQHPAPTVDAASRSGTAANPTINRRECIALFEQLLAPETPHRYLHVIGGPKTGKTHLLMKVFPAMAAAHSARCAALDLRGQTVIELLNSTCGLLGYELSFPAFDQAYQQWLNWPRAQADNLQDLLSNVSTRQVPAPRSGPSTTNFLDLQRVLASLYPDLPSIRRIVDISGINQARIDFDPKAINSWHAVLKEAEKLGQVVALLDAVEPEYGTNAEFRSAYDLYRRSRVQTDSGRTDNQEPGQAEQEEQKGILPVLTRAFVADLRPLDDRSLVLIFDRAEEAQPEVQRWLMDMLQVQLAGLPHVCVVVGGREMTEPAGTYAAFCHRHTLGVVEDEEEYVRFCRDIQATISEASIPDVAKVLGYSPGLFAETVKTLYMAKDG
ncbi:MAG: effector-associated domain EAD1-containing protein [Caldilineaceae bacterium]